ncbi:OB-fold domain-containing protein [Endozoicomonas ascidiicola]|uniref:OB-fold domain-containing protein n=1 Tax=Endozoicomonas ascidiicola TaxID=1698521 RepID=UPI000AD9D10F|nr:OB-fold domain-containing protein [Endozoicomonas ascidiicola]
MASEWLSELKAMVGREYGRVYAWDKVNAPMVRQWCEVMGIDNPLYTDEEYAKQTEFDGIVAPPAMLQAWCLEGLHQNNYPEGSTDENPYGALKLIEKQGYPAVVAVNSELSFDRYITMGEKLYYVTKLTEVGDEKTTALGTGFFVTLVMTFFSENTSAASDDEKIGELLFRVFKFKPHQQPEKNSAPAEVPVIKRPKPGISDDTRFFWEGCEAKELRIQHCKTCDELQHPPAPVCMHCQSFELDYQVVSGSGELYSFVVMHYPEVPPFDYPNPIGLIQLDEGVRVPAGLVGVDNKNDLKIGQRVQVEFQTFDEELTLPMFRIIDSNAQARG